MWKTTVYSHGVAVESRLRTFIDQQLQTALGGLEKRIGLVHVRLYGDVEGTDLYTCYVSVDVLPNGGIALGDTAADPRKAVDLAVARVGSAVREVFETRPGPWNDSSQSSACGIRSGVGW